MKMVALYESDLQEVFIAPASYDHDKGLEAAYHATEIRTTTPADWLDYFGVGKTARKKLERKIEKGKRVEITFRASAEAFERALADEVGLEYKAVLK